MNTDDLARLIDAKLTVLVQLLALSRRQVEVIGAGQLATLLTVLAGKQQLVNQLQALDRELAPYQQQSPEERRWPSVDDRRRCQHQAARCEAVLREILVTEKRAEEMVTERRDTTAEQLAAVNQAANAQRAYIAPPAAPVSAFDIREG